MSEKLKILKKLKLSNIEFEVKEEREESYLDNHLNEVVYLFENSKKNIIIFEDIDRFEDNYIFVKLREINILLNHRLEVKKKKPIKFIY